MAKFQPPNYNAFKDMNYYLRLLVKSRQTTDRQKATHMSPPCKGHRWAQKRSCLCACVWICETCVVHHFIGTGLHCAPATCVEHHRPALGTMFHKGDLCPGEVGGAQGTCTKRTLFRHAHCIELGGHEFGGQVVLHRGPRPSRHCYKAVSCS